MSDSPSHPESSEARRFRAGDVVRVRATGRRERLRYNPFVVGDIGKRYELLLAADDDGHRQALTKTAGRSTASPAREMARRQLDALNRGTVFDIPRIRALVVEAVERAKADGLTVGLARVLGVAGVQPFGAKWRPYASVVSPLDCVLIGQPAGDASMLTSAVDHARAVCRALGLSEPAEAAFLFVGLVSLEPYGSPRTDFQRALYDLGVALRSELLASGGLASAGPKET